MKNVLIRIVVCLCACLVTSSGVAALYTYDFAAGETAVPTASGLSFGAFSRQNVTAATASGVFTSSGWSTGASQDVSEYVQFTISLTAGGQFTLNSLSFYLDSHKANGVGNDGGPNQLSVSVFSGLLAPGSGNGNTALASQTFANVQDTKQTLNWDLPDQNTTTALTLRFYGWGAENVNGTLLLDNVVVDGTLTPVPEPVTVAAGIFGGLLIGGRVLRNRFPRWFRRRRRIGAIA